MRVKYLTRSIRGTKARCRFVQLSTNTVVSDDVFVNGRFADVNRLFKAIEKQTDDDFRLISIDEYSDIVQTYRITEQEFIKNGELISTETVEQ